MLYPVAVLTALLALFLNIPLGQYVPVIVISILAPIFFIAFLILPGLIYEDGFNYSWHGFGKNQLHYHLFLGLTFGFGPLYLFFKKYDPMLKKYFKNI